MAGNTGVSAGDAAGSQDVGPVAHQSALTFPRPPAAPGASVRIRGGAWHGVWPVHRLCPPLLLLPAPGPGHVCARPRACPLSHTSLRTHAHGARTRQRVKRTQSRRALAASLVVRLAPLYTLTHKLYFYTHARRNRGTAREAARGCATRSSISPTPSSGCCLIARVPLLSRLVPLLSLACGERAGGQQRAYGGRGEEGQSSDACLRAYACCAVLHALACAKLSG